MQNPSPLAPRQDGTPTQAMIEVGAEYLAPLLVDGEDPETVLTLLFAEMRRAQRQSGCVTPGPLLADL